jgi:hypothetical protein
LGGI